MKIYFLSSVSGASDAIGVIEERTKGMKLGEIWDKYGVITDGKDKCKRIG